MKTITEKQITGIIKELCVQANFNLRKDVLVSLNLALKKETNARAKKLLQVIVDNAQVARKEKLAICQDTGMPIVFAQVGNEVSIKGDFNKAVNKGIEQGYKEASLRNSIVRDPILRGASSFSPTVIHVDIVKGDRVKFSVLPKGFGCENKSQLKMFNPTATVEDIKKFVIDVVKNAGPDACPPYVIGVGIGGTADFACLLAKKALLLDISRKTQVKSLELELLKEINELNIGPMGLGGSTTALAVKVKTYPTHIAGLPVAVNVSCHALRSAEGIL